MVTIDLCAPVKLIVAGGRDYKLTKDDEKRLDRIINEHNVVEIVSGGARGVDTCAIEYARRHGIKYTVFPAQWDKYGRGAGPIRNIKMANYADGLVAFPGGRGTHHMLQEARKRNLLVIDLTGGVSYGKKKAQAFAPKITRKETVGKLRKRR